MCIFVPSTGFPYQSSIYKLINATLIKTEIRNGTDLIYIKPTGKSEVLITCTITKKTYSYFNEIKNKGTDKNYSVEIKKYLESSDRFNLNSEVIKTTARLLKGTTDIETINNILNWLNTTKTYRAIPPIWTTVDDLIKSKTVECGTASITVIALSRACGIPARQVWGPIEAGRDFSPENYLKGHAWFEFYLQNVGWIPVEQFDKNSVGLLPASYIRMMTSYTHIFNKIPLSNVVTIMHNDTYGDIVKYEKK